MIIQEKGQTKIIAYAAVRRDSYDGKVTFEQRTMSTDFNLTKILTAEYRAEFPSLWAQNISPLIGYCKLEITAEMLPFMGTSPFDK